MMLNVHRNQPQGLFGTGDTIIIIHCLYIALFSALRQMRCVHVPCGSEWVTVSFYSNFFLYNNNNGCFYGAWSLARSRAQCIVQKAAEKCINTYIFISTEVVYLQCYLLIPWLAPCETAAISVQVLCKLYNHAPVCTCTVTAHLLCFWELCQPSKTKQKQVSGTQKQEQVWNFAFVHYTVAHFKRPHPQVSGFHSSKRWTRHRPTLLCSFLIILMSVSVSSLACNAVQTF